MSYISHYFYLLWESFSLAYWDSFSFRYPYNKYIIYASLFYGSDIEIHSQLETYTTNLFNMQELFVNANEIHSQLGGLGG